MVLSCLILVRCHTIKKYHLKKKLPSHIAALRATLQNMKFADRTEEYAANAEWIVLRIAIDDGV